MKTPHSLPAIAALALLLAIAPQASAQTTAYVSSNAGTGITTVNTEDLSSGLMTASMFSQKGLEISPDGKRLYVAVGGFLQVIDVAADTSITLIQIGSSVHSVALSPDGKLAYTANGGAQSVSVIDTESLTIVADVPVLGRDPRDIVVTPDGALVYVSASSSAFVTAIETANNTVVADINVGAGPDGLAVTPDGAFVFAAVSVTSGVAKIDVSNNTVVHEIGGLSGEPTVVAVTPDGERLYVATNTDSSLTAIHIGPDTVLTKVNAGASNHRGMAITPDGQHVYVTNLNAASVSIIAIGSTTTAASKTADSLVTMVSTTTPPWDVTIGARASGGDPTAAENDEIPASSFRLIGNAPNPFSAETSIIYELDEAGEVAIEVLDVQGREVRSFRTGLVTPGMHNLNWDGTDVSGADAAAGLYMIRMQVGHASESMSVLKVR